MDEYTITIDDAIDYLNELLEADRPAIAALVANRVPCNMALALHPTAQVANQHGGHWIGLLGVLNGLFGTVPEGPKYGWGTITAVFEDDERSISGKSLLRFQRT